MDRIAIFLARHEPAGKFPLAKSYGITDTSGLDLGFLNVDAPGIRRRAPVFRQHPPGACAKHPARKKRSRKLDLNYYIPCTCMSRTIAVLGLGKTLTATSSPAKTCELLESLAGYIGIAIQNARLYRVPGSRRSSEYERLKEFNENIVESISVGVLAVDLEDRIESWNSQMEAMYALAAAEALGQVLQ